MQRFFERLIEKKILVPVIFCLLALAGAALLPFVNIRYDMAEYLPQNAGTKQAIDVAKAEFDYPGTAEVMAKDVTMAQAAELKQKIAVIPGVQSVLWLDDVADITRPEAFIPADTRKDYYKDGCALFQVEFTGDNYEQSTSDALVAIRKLDSTLLVSGNAESSRTMKNTLAGEMSSILLIVIPICVLILMLASSSWLDPFLYLFVIGISIAINMGTNAFFPGISFITNSMAAVLQLAISMDYSIFLLHRYLEERDNGMSVKDALVHASVQSLSSISASALTTVAGFAALLFMQYRIGSDIGLVLAKGILISFITVVMLLPVMIAILHKALEKTRHRPFLPRFGGIARFAIKLRYVILAAALLIAIPSLLAQSKNDYLYGDSSASEGQGQAYLERQEIIEKFGVSNTVMLLVPKGDKNREIQLTQALAEVPHIRKVTGLVTVADPTISSALLPKMLVDRFESQHYSRILLSLNIDGETPETFQAVKDIRILSQQYYPDTWLAAGQATSIADIKDTVTKDSLMVTVISLAAVGIIVLLTFRSLTIPLILLLVIEASVWFNMAVPYFTDFKMAYLGYLIISSLQLGATIDYGILLSNRYLGFRKELPPKEAAMSAIKASGPSIMVSALILATAGFGFGLVSKVDSIAQLGSLIGRGALASCVMTILLLPGLLTVFDKIIMRRKSRKEVHQHE